jgi:Xaa-Pro aminopeptidase
MDYKGRLHKLRQMINDSDVDALLVTNPYNRQYMSGFTGSAGYLVISMDDAVLFTDFRYRTQAPEQVVGFDVIEHGLTPIDTIYTWLNDHRITRLGFEEDTVVYGQFTSIQQSLSGIILKPTSSLIEKLRMVKDDAEISIMTEAALLADRTFEYIVQRIKPGITERQIARDIEFFMRSQGATSSSFDTIVASGERSALPHGVASDRIIQNNEFVKLDFGAYFKDYCSDITRTVFVGKPTEKHLEIYNIVLEAQLAGLDGIRTGMRGKEADALTRDVIKRYGYNDYFGHGTGHGLGMEIHEAPRLSQSGDTVLEPGMTVTVEPGIYLPGFGGVRIEDDVVMTDNGAVRLTQSTKALIVINS